MLIYDFETKEIIVRDSGRVMGRCASLTKAALMFPGVVFNVRNIKSIL
jgi:hypothetical protein